MGFGGADENILDLKHGDDCNTCECTENHKNTKLEKCRFYINYISIFLSGVFFFSFSDLKSVYTVCLSVPRFLLKCPW